MGKILKELGKYLLTVSLGLIDVLASYLLNQGLFNFKVILWAIAVLVSISLLLFCLSDQIKDLKDK